MASDNNDKLDGCQEFYKILVHIYRFIKKKQNM